MKYLFVALFILPLVSFCQQNSKQQIVNNTFTSRGSGHYSVTVVFHRNKQAIIAIQFTCDSLQQMFNAVELEKRKLGNGVNATYLQITYQKPGSKKIELDVDLYNQKDPETNSNARQEIYKLKDLNFISGIIYFSGYGFTNVTSVKVTDKDNLEACYNKSGPGTTITLENCFYKKLDGSLSQPLNRSIKLY